MAKNDFLKCLLRYNIIFFILLLYDNALSLRFAPSQEKTGFGK